MALDYTTALVLTAALSITCAAILHRCTARPPGAPRVAPAAAAAAANLAIPLLFDHTTAYVSVAMISFLATWLSSFKALAWAAGRGPLAAQTWTLPQFVALYSLPIVPTDPAARSAAGAAAAGDGSASGKSLPSPLLLAARWAVKTAVTAAVVFGLLLEPPTAVKNFLYVLGMYGMLGSVMDGPASLVLSSLGLSLEPHFRPPWESQSISQFWGRQWNQAASNSLRTTIYEPVLEGAWVRKPKVAAEQQQRQQPDPRQGLSGRVLLALCAGCLASGVIHELIMWYVTGRTTGGTWLLFFTLQGPLIVAERVVLLRLSRARVRLPRLLRIALTLGTLLFLAHHLFFAPAERMGLPAHFARAMRHSFASLAGVESGMLDPARWQQVGS